MKIDAEQILHFKEIPQYLIGKFSCKNIKSPHCTIGIPVFKILFVELERLRTDKVLGIHSCMEHSIPIENKTLIAVRV